ncbi:hypothetical protein HDU98_003558, partial [Podochytrium sp. JEL0797]
MNFYSSNSGSAPAVVHDTLDPLDAHIQYGVRKHKDPHFFLPVKYKIPEGSRALACVRMHLELHPQYYVTEKPDLLGDRIPTDLYAARINSLNEMVATEGYASIQKLKWGGRINNYIGWAIFAAGFALGIWSGNTLYILLCVVCKIVLMWMPLSAPV